MISIGDLSTSGVNPCLSESWLVHTRKTILATQITKYERRFTLPIPISQMWKASDNPDNNRWLMSSEC